MKKSLLTLLVLCAFVANTIHAQYTQLTDFTGPVVLTGTAPSGDQNFISVGNSLYGMTTNGGNNLKGTIFKINHDGTGYAKLLDFDGVGNGGWPKGSLLFDGNSLYGMTSGGGNNNKGTIFKINLDGTGYAKLLDLDGFSGYYPSGSLISDGTSLYGMTSQGGGNNLGVIFKINTDGTGYTILSDFGGSGFGKMPLGSLIYDGNFLYGMTAEGGGNGWGVIFKLNPDGTGYTQLLDFDYTNTGGHPNGSLLFDGVSLYGMTTSGGTNSQGTLFKINTDGTGYMKLLDFDGTINGNFPLGSLCIDGTSLFGMTQGGGMYDFGTLFKISTDGTGYNKLLEFDGTVNGSSPYGSLFSDGTSLFGMTKGGGTYGWGTVFKINPNGTGYTKLLDFSIFHNGVYPHGSLLSYGNALYGMTRNGGTSDAGTIFKMNPDGTGITKLLDFAGSGDGSHPLGSLISVDTMLYGMTRQGGTSGLGTIFKIHSNGTGYTKLVDFTGYANGSYPEGSLLFDGNSLYGTTSYGGTYGGGTLFKINPDGTGFSKLLDFYGNGNGNNPCGSLISDGVSLYGMTQESGTSNNGTIFKINPDGTGYTKILDFDGAGNGSSPKGSLLLDGTSLYGMTAEGGGNDLGVIFKINTDGTGYNKLLEFDGAVNGSFPYGSLFSDGTSLFGMTSGGGVYGLGTLFKINLNGAGFTKLLDFDGNGNGRNPYGSLILNGNYLYGTTEGGGSANFGTVFKYQYCFPPTADAPGNVVACNTYTLPNLSVGNYYTGAGGTGSLLNAGDAVSSTQSIYVYATNGTCSDENSFDVTINIGVSNTDVQIACGSYTWIDGNTYTSSNNTATFNMVGGAANGCDSLITLNLTILNPAMGTDTRTECNSYTWIDGNTYTASNNTATFNMAGGAANGCDSLITLNLTILNPAMGTDTRTECNSYTWIDGNTYNASNNIATFNMVGGAANGCDSLVTLNLTINSVTDLSTSISGVTISAGNTVASYQWLDCDNNKAVITGATGQSFTATVNGNYAVELTENGCIDTSACVTISSVGILENSFGSNIMVYPNPTSGRFTIDLGAVYEYSDILISDLAGKCIDSKRITQSRLLNLSIDEPTGVYLISVQSGNKKALIRLVKE